MFFDVIDSNIRIIEMYRVNETVSWNILLSQNESRELIQKINKKAMQLASICLNFKVKSTQTYTRNKTQEKKYLKN